MTKSKPTCSTSLLEGRVYMLAKRPIIRKADAIAECLKLLGAKIATELGASVTHLVTMDGSTSATVQKKIASLQKKGAAIETLSVDEVLEQLRLPSQLVGELVLGSDADREFLATLTGAYPYGMDRPELKGADLRGLSGDPAALSRLQLVDVDLRDAVLLDASLMKVTRTNADGADLRELFLGSVADSTFRGANLTSGRIHSACTGTVFDGAALEGSRIRLYANPARPDDPPSFRDCSMDLATIDGVGWSSVDFSGSRLTRSEWSDIAAPGVRLQRCDLSRSSIKRTRFTDGDLSSAKLCGARLEEVDLTGANLSGADFTGAALSGVTFDPSLDLRSVQGLAEALAANTHPSAALSALDAAVAKGSVALTVHVAPGPDDHGTESPDGHDGEQFVLSIELSGESPEREVYCRMWAPDGRLHRGPMPSFVEGFASVMAFGASGRVRFESISVKVRKASHTAAQITALLVPALAEVFGQEIPDAKELETSTKAYNAERKAKREAESAENKREHQRFLQEAAERKEQALQAAAASREARPEPARPAADFETFVEALEVRAQASRVKSAKKMLKGSGFQLFHDTSDSNKVLGVIKSQTDEKLVYACKLQADGGFSCCTQNLRPCGGLRGALCKHQLVLLIGLVKEGLLDAATMDEWVKKSLDQSPTLDKEEMSEPLLRFKGIVAGESDWRPTETIPEDFYAF